MTSSIKRFCDATSQLATSSTGVEFELGVELPPPPPPQPPKVTSNSNNQAVGADQALLILQLLIIILLELAPNAVYSLIDYRQAYRIGRGIWHTLDKPQTHHAKSAANSSAYRITTRRS